MQSTLHPQAHGESARLNRSHLSQHPRPPAPAYLRPVAFVDPPLLCFEHHSVQLVQSLRLAS